MTDKTTTMKHKTKQLKKTEQTITIHINKTTHHTTPIKENRTNNHNTHKQNNTSYNTNQREENKYIKQMFDLQML